MAWLLFRIPFAQAPDARVDHTARRLLRLLAEYFDDQDFPTFE
jgi:hypothetical protein